MPGPEESRPAPRRLLAVTAVAPWPVRDGYSLRAGHLLEGLARSRDVTVVSPEPAEEPDPAAVPESIRWIRLVGIPATNSLPWRPERQKLLERVRREAGGGYDVAVLWNGTEFLAREIPGLPPAVAERIDCEALQAWRGWYRGGSLRQKVRSARRAVELLLYERRTLSPCSAVAVTGPDDARALRRISGHPRVAVVPNGVGLPELADLPGESETPTVVFTGTLDYAPNVDAVRHFAEDVWPAVRRSVPEARFVAAGREPAPAVRELAHLPGVEIHPDVDDMTVEIRRAWVAVAPMRHGSGVKNKVLEAWAASRPVVLSELATNGLDLDDAARSLVCQGPEEMARRLVELLQAPSLREELGRAGRRLAGDRHGWRRSIERMAALVEEAAAAREPTGSAVPA